MVRRVVMINVWTVLPPGPGCSRAFCQPFSNKSSLPSPYMAAWGPLPLPLPPSAQVRTALPPYTEQCVLRLTCSATPGIEKTGDHLIKIGQTNHRAAAPETGDAAQLLLALARLLLEEIKLLSCSWSSSGCKLIMELVRLLSCP